RVHVAAARENRVPLRVGVWLGDARRLNDPRHAHFVRECHFAVLDATRDGRRTDRIGCAGQWNVSFAGEQTRGRIETDPARSGDIDLAPRVEIGEVLRGALRSVD